MMTGERLKKALELADKLDSSVYSGKAEDTVWKGEFAVINSGERYELSILVRELVEIVKEKLCL